MKITAALRVKNISDQVSGRVSFTEKNEGETEFEISAPQATRPSNYQFMFCINSTKAYTQAKSNPRSQEALNGLEKEQKKMYGKLRPAILGHLNAHTNFTLIAIGPKRSGKTYSIFGKKGVSGLFTLVCDDILRTLADEDSSRREWELAELENRQKVIDLLESSILIRNETYNFHIRHTQNLEIRDDQLIEARVDPADKFMVFVSSAEIVQERAYDLLSNISRCCKASKVFELPGVGFFLENQIRIRVKTLKELETVLEIIHKNKAVLRNLNGVYQSDVATFTKIDVFQRRTDDPNKVRSCFFAFLDTAGASDYQDANADRLYESYASVKSGSALRKLFYDLSEKVSEKTLENLKHDQTYQETLAKLTERPSLYQDQFLQSTITNPELEAVRQRLISRVTRENLMNIQDDILSQINFEGSLLTKLLKASFSGGSELLLMFHVSLTKKKMAQAFDTLNSTRVISDTNMEQLHLLKRDETTFIRGLEAQRVKLVKEVSRVSKAERLSQLQRAQILDTLRDRDSVSQKLKEIDFLLQARLTQKLSESIRLSKVMKFEADHKFFRGLKNLDSDPLLNLKISYPFRTHADVVITKVPAQIAMAQKSGIFRDLDVMKDRILVNNVGVAEDHATISVRESAIFLSAKTKFAASNTFVNGEDLEGYYQADSQRFERQLIHLDRLIVGTFHTFLVFDPYSASQKDPEVSEFLIDWEFCQLEKFQRQEANEKTKIEQILKKNELELQAKVGKIHEEFERDSRDLRAQMEAVEAATRQAVAQLQAQAQRVSLKEGSLGESQAVKKVSGDIAQIQEKANQKINELSKQKRDVSLRFEEALRSLERETEMNSIYQVLNLNLEKKIIGVYSKITEANQIAAALGRNIEFHPFLETLNVYEAISENPENMSETILKVKVVNNERRWVNIWSVEKFQNRLVLFREELDNFQRTRVPLFTGKNDPFYDEKEYLLVAKGVILLKNILYRFDVSPKVGLVSLEGNIGYINTRVSCLTETDVGVDENEMRKLIRQPTDLIEKNVCANFRIVFEKILIYDIGKFSNKSAYLFLNIKTGQETTQLRTFNFVIRDNEIALDWNSVVRIPNITQEIIDYYLNNHVQISLMVNDYNVDDLGITRKVKINRVRRSESWVPAEELSGSDDEVASKGKQPSKFCQAF